MVDEVGRRQGLLPGDNVYLKNNKDSSLAWASLTHKEPGKHPFSLKNIPYRYSSYRIKNMSKGITSLKINKCPQAYKLKRDKVPVIPFLSLSSESGTRQQEGKKSS